MSYRDGVVYGTSAGYGIMAISVEDPENPELLNEPLPWHVIENFVVKDRLAYVLDSGELSNLQILDISDPTDPVIIGELDEVGGRYQSIDVLNDYVYHLNRNGIKIINISDPTAPELVAEYEEPQQYLFNKTKIIDGCIYITGSYRVDGRSKHLVVWDLSDPLNPELTFSAEDFEDGNGYGSSWHAGNYLYQNNGGGDEMLIYSLANPAEPELVAHWVGGSGRQFFVCNSILYVSGENRLDMYSAENLEPEFLGFVEFPYLIQSIAVEGEIAYLSCHEVGMMCLSLEDPFSPEIVGHYDTPGDLRKIISNNGNIFAATVIEFGVYQLDYEIGDNADFQISMHEGWNLVSSPFVPEDRDIEALFSRLTVRQNLIMVKDQNGRFYLPAHDFNNIPFWDVNYGYQVKLNADDNLWITGEEVEADRPIPLQQGWSLAAYFPEQAIETRTAFANIADQLLMAKDGDGQFYTPEHNFNNIPPLHRGAGYQVKVSEEVELIWNVEGEGLASANFEDLTLSHFIPVNTTDKNMSIIITGLQDEGEVGAFTSSGICVGATAFRNQDQVGLAVWGDDESTDEIDGLAEGESFGLKYLDKNIELEVKAIHKGKGLIYETNSFTVIDIAPKAEIPDEYYLSQNYPNPFNSTTRIKYGLPEAGHVSLTVYDISGRVVQTLVDMQLKAGHHEIEWNAKTVSSGLYFVQLEASHFKAINKVVLAK